MENLDLSNLAFVEQNMGDIAQLTLNLVVSAILGWLAGWHFCRFGSTLSGRLQIAKLLPFIAMTVFIVITVVKASLALSLGLVGALSIVRFRTPIKEPEELGYLFLAIAVGLGLGAGHTTFTLVIAPLVLVIYSISRGIRTPKGVASGNGSVLSIVTYEPNASPESGLALTPILDTVANKVAKADVRNISMEGERTYIDIVVMFDERNSDVTALMHELKRIQEVETVRFHDVSRIPGV